MTDALAVSRLARELSLPPVVARLLVRRGLIEPQVASDFLDPKLRALSAPEELPNMAKAVDRLDAALLKKERIVLYGDYDVDGVSSLALLKRFLMACGGTVDCFLPLRAEEGYGLSEAGITRCVADHRPELLIAVDCGTNSVAEIASLRRQGVDVIVLDHHEPEAALPDAVALVNPKLGTGWHYLCSVGIVFKVAHALLKKSPQPKVDLRDYLDLVALGTIADLVPLVGENRIFVHRGLRQMATSHWPGISALMLVAGIKAPLKGSDIGFRLGPRINAAGRLGTAQEALRLLLTDDRAEADKIAANLDHQNRERQNVERLVSEQVEAWVAENFDAERDASIVAGARDWHQGVLGIVASRIMRKRHRPTLIIGFDETGKGKGSGRSIEGFSIVGALQECREHLEKFGGHEMAAGVSVHEDNFASFRAAFEKIVRAGSDAEMLTPRLRLDEELMLEEINLDLLAAQEHLEPFGMANAQPVLFARALRPTGEPRVLKEKHLRFDFSSGRNRISAIYFNGAENTLPRLPWDVAFTLERNEFNGRNEPQMNVVAIRSAI